MFNYKDTGRERSWLFWWERGSDGKSETARDKCETEIWLVVNEIREMERGKKRESEREEIKSWPEWLYFHINHFPGDHRCGFGTGGLASLQRGRLTKTEHTNTLAQTQASTVSVAITYKTRCGYTCAHTHKIYYLSLPIFHSLSLLSSDLWFSIPHSLHLIMNAG